MKSLNAFIRTGCLVLSVLLIGFAVWNFAAPTLLTASIAGDRKIPIYSVDTDKPQIALSFDAAWGNEETQALLDILAAHNVRATFFMTGGWVENYPDDVKAIAAAGHDLGNHSQNHKQMSQLTVNQCSEEIQSVHDFVKTLTGIEMNLFRPPYGDYNNRLVEVANGLGYHVINWNIDSLDWKDYGAGDIVSRILDSKDLGNGSIILMHNGAKYTKDALDRIITGLQDKGYALVPISQLIYTDNYTTDSAGRQIQVKSPIADCGESVTIHGFAVNSNIDAPLRVACGDGAVPIPPGF